MKSQLDVLSQLNSKGIIKEGEYKQCAGNKCPNQGISLLKIIYLNKSGWFCDSCKEFLMHEGLVAEFKDS